MRWLLLSWLLASQANAIISVQDDAGRTVAVLRPAQRVITLAPHATELVAALAPARIVGVDRSSNFPAEVLGLPKVGDFRSLNVEAILALHPDLVVVWESSAVTQPLALLAKQGIPVFVSKPQTPDDVAGNLRRLGHLLGKEDLAASQASNIARRDKVLSQRYANARPIKVFLQVNETPLLTLSSRSFLGRALAECGAIGPYDNAGVEAPIASPEVVLGFAPELLITTGNRATLESWKKWSAIPAVRHSGYLSIAGDEYVRPGPRLIDGLEKLCAAIDKIRQ